MKNEGPAQHRKHTPYGLTPFQMNVIHLVLGAGYPLTQGEIGFMNNAMSGGKVPPNLFKPRFDKICQQGFLSLVGVDEVWNNPKERRYMVTKRGRAAVADMGILNGGDYHYYRNFDAYRTLRRSAAEHFIDTLARVGHEPFKQAANAARHGAGHRAALAAPVAEGSAV